MVATPELLHLAVKKMKAVISGAKFGVLTFNLGEKIGIPLESGVK
jgi:hypothetical protein